MPSRGMAPTISDPARFFEALVRDMDEACIVVGRDQRVMYMNRRAEQVTGVAAAQGIGKRCLEVFRCPACTLQCGLFDRGEVRNTHASSAQKVEAWSCARTRC